MRPMNLRPILILAALSRAVATLSAQAASQPSAPAAEHAPTVSVPDDPSALLSLTLETAWNRFGPPKRMISVRGNEPWQDDVAFEYAGGVAIFWYREHLWQIRLSAGYSGSCFGIFLGDGPEKALSLLGQPERIQETYLEWRLPYQGYPVRLRALTRDGVISELYVYRSDF